MAADGVAAGWRQMGQSPDVQGFNNWLDSNEHSFYLQGCGAAALTCHIAISSVIRRTDVAAKEWTIADIPDQCGNVAVITGGNSGIGYEAASALAGKGAHVILAVRNIEKGQAAVAAIGRAHPGAAA